MAASRGGVPCARSPPMMPASTSPDPAVARKGEPLAFTASLPVTVGNRRVGSLEENHAPRFGRGAGDITQAIARPVKEPPEFSGMWRENAAFMDPVEEVLAAFAKCRQGISIENKGLAGGECRHHEVSSAGTGARTRTKHTGMDMSGRHQLGKVTGSGKGMIHHCRVMYGVSEKGGPRHGTGDETGSGTQAGSRRKPRCTTGFETPTQNDQMPAGMLVGIQRRPWPAIPPQGRGVADNSRRNCRHDRIPDTYVRNCHIAAQAPSGHQNMSRLAAAEGHGRLGRHRATPNPPRVAVNSAWHVDSDDGNTDSGEHGGKRRIKIAGETGAEEGIHHKVRITHACRRHGRGLTRPQLRHPAGGARHGIRPQRADTDRPSAVRKNSRRDVTVATVSSRTRKNHDPSGRQAFHRGFRDGGAGTFHEHVLGDPGGHGAAIGLLHFSDCEKRMPGRIARPPARHERPVKRSTRMG